MKKIHQFSGLYLSLFVTLHLINHLTALHAIDTHIAVMQLLRSIYKQPLIEGGLILAIVVQVISGVKLLFPYLKGARKRKQPLSSNPWKRWQLYSGLYLAFFLLLHTSATAGAYYGMGIDTNFYFAAIGVQQFPSALFFVPYYLLGVLSYFVHLTCWLQIAKGYSRGKTYFIWIGVIIAILIMGALVQPMDIPASY